MKRSYSQQSSPPPQASTSALLLPTKKTKKVRSTTATPLASSPPGGSPPYVPSNLNVVTTGMSPARDRSRSRSASASVFSKGPGEGSRKAGSVASGAGVKKKKVRVSKGKGKQKEREGTVSTPALTLETSNQPSISGAPSARSNDDDAEVEEEDLEYSDDEFGADKRANERMKEELRVLMGHFDENQMDRYESFRRSGLAKGSVRKLVNQILQQSVSDSVLTVVRGFSKVFVGEIVEKARSVSHHAGPLTPADLREGYRLYLLEHEGAGSGTIPKKKMFVK